MATKPPDYYDGDDAQPSAESSDDMDGQQALLPRSILMGRKFDVGDEVVLKIDEIRPSEIVVSYSEAPSGDDDKGDSADAKEEGEPAMAEGGGESGGDDGMYS